MKLLLALILSLTLTVPAYADYSGSAVLDWSSLRFSGGTVLLNDHAAPVLQLQGVNIVGDIGSGGVGLWEVNDWTPVPFAFDLPGVGSVAASVTDTQMIASGTLVSTGLVDSAVGRQSGFEIPVTGEITATVHYSLTHIGVPPLVSGWATNEASVQMYLGEQSAIASLSSTTPGSQSGTLSLTHLFHAGDSGTFTLGAFLMPVPAQRGGSVPVPGMLWPSIALFVGLGLLAWRRAR